MGRGGAGSVRDRTPTEFEVVTALAFTYYAQHQPDWVVVEVGLGDGLCDNVITPAVSVITNIALDHTDARRYDCGYCP